MGLPDAVERVTGAFLSLMDDAAPGLVEGLYLHGSLGFGEWYDGRSDIDYVAVLAKPPDDATAELLRQVHAELAELFPRSPFDGFHLAWDQLARSPYECPDVPCTQGGYFHEEARLDVHPVTWHELARHGVTVRGPQLEEVDIWADSHVLRQYTHDNLREYWEPEVATLGTFPNEAGKPDIVAWCVLGVSRLHHLLATGRLTSKIGAGHYALRAFDDRWRPVVSEAIAIRETGRPGDMYDGEASRRGLDTIEFADMVVRSGLGIGV